jgi:hypothetical protein
MRPLQGLFGSPRGMADLTGGHYTRFFPLLFRVFEAGYRG